MNVLYLTPNINRASSNIPTEGWFTLLRPSGLAPVLVSPGSGAFQAWARSQGIPTHEVALPFPDARRPWRYARALAQLRRHVKSHRIDLIHAVEHTAFPIAADLGRLCRLPVVVGVHSRIDVAFGRWAFGGPRCPTRLFFLTRGSQEVCRASVEGVVPESRWRILRNGLDISRFQPDAAAGRAFREAHDLGSGLLVGAASWLRPGKQLDHLFRAAARIPEVPFTVVLAGGVAPGEEEYSRTLLEGGRHLLDRRFRYVGCLDDLRGFYNAIDMYANTSLEEASGISVMEALACGCPVLGYPSVCIDEQILPDGGEIVSQDDEPALAAAMRRWLLNPEERTSRHDGARRRAETMFDIRRISSELWQEYEAVLGGNRD